MAIFNTFTSGPYIFSYEKTNALNNDAIDSCNGSITNVTLSGGTPPYKISWLGPSSFTSRSTNLTNLCVGTYTATTTDANSLSNTATIEIKNITKPSLTATTIDNSCTTNINGFCSIKVTNFEHQLDSFTYILYKDGDINSVYNGTTGQEEHTFTNLRNGKYVLTAYDGKNVDLDSQISKGLCQQGYLLDTTNAFGDGGIPPLSAVTEFDKQLEYRNRFIPFSNTEGPATVAQQFDVGLKSDGTIDVDNPYAWFYTGDTSNRLTDSGSTWYLGSSGLTMNEGDQVGPSGYNAATDIGKFYYNSYINKFVFRFRSGVATNRWFTYDPKVDQGNDGNPSACSAFISTPDFIGTDNLSSGAVFDYSVTGATNDVVLFSDVFGTTTDGVLEFGQGGSSNINSTPALISKCSFDNYTHEATIGSEGTDDDRLGFVLCSFRDDLGLYGTIGETHDIILEFNNNSATNSIRLRFNYFNDANAFRVDETSAYDIRPCRDTISPCTTQYSGVSTVLLERPIANSPFTDSNWNTQGSSRIKIDRYGLLGEKFKIQMTDAFVQSDVGSSFPYNSNYEINFNLLDKNTWTGETESAPSFAKNGDLDRFLGANKFGYFYQSQRNTRFYHIHFTGTQRNTISTTVGYGSSTSQEFDFLTDLQGVDITTNEESDFYTSIGNGSQVGNPTVPTISPTPSVNLQTSLIPLLRLSGATKIDTETSNYNIYDIGQLEPKEEQTLCISLNFEWYKYTNDIVNGDVIPYYTVHPYLNEENKFDETPLVFKIFDNPTDISLTYDSLNQVIGQGVSIVDCLDGLDFDSGYYEYIIKPNYIFKDKLKNLQTNQCNVIITTGTTTGNTRTNRWFDSFNADVNFGTKGGYNINGDFSWTVDGESFGREYGTYDSTTDYYFVTLPKIEQADIFTSDISYGEPNECGNLFNQRTIVISGSTTGTSESSFLVEGQPYNVYLDFPSGGDVQVILNGLTLTKSDFEDLSDDGDYYFNGTSVIKIRENVLEEYDIINVFYVPGTSERSYYYSNYKVPSSIPVISGTTSVDSNTFYTNGYYYFYKLEFEPIGDIGITLNGNVLTQGNDFVLVSNDTIQFLNVTYPSDIQPNDLIGQFYFTKVSLQGTSLKKNPIISTKITQSPRYIYEVILLVYNTSGRVVFNDSKIVQKGVNIVNVDFEVTVPTYGEYSYKIINTLKYQLLNGDFVTKSESTEVYRFEIPAAVFFDKSGGQININSTPTQY